MHGRERRGRLNPFASFVSSGTAWGPQCEARFVSQIAGGGFVINFNMITGAPEEIRTPDPQIRSLVLYPAELRARRSA